MVTNVLTPYYKFNQDGVSHRIHTRHSSLIRELPSLTLQSTLTLKNLMGRDLTTRTSSYVLPLTSPSPEKSLLLPQFC